MPLSPSLFTSPLQRAAAEMEKRAQEQQLRPRRRPAVWDCDSSLYDSFEFKSFKRHLDSAIASKTALSTKPDQFPPEPVKAGVRKEPTKKGTSPVLRLLRMKVPVTCGGERKGWVVDGAHVVVVGGALPVIPKDGGRDRKEQAVRKTASERFAGRVGMLR